MMRKMNAKKHCSAAGGTHPPGGPTVAAAAVNQPHAGPGWSFLVFSPMLATQEMCHVYQADWTEFWKTQQVSDKYLSTGQAFPCFRMPFLFPGERDKIFP